MHSRSLIFQEFFDLRGCSTVSGPEIFGDEIGEHGAFYFPKGAEGEDVVFFVEVEVNDSGRIKKIKIAESFPDNAVSMRSFSELQDPRAIWEDDSYFYVDQRRLVEGWLESEKEDDEGQPRGSLIRSGGKHWFFTKHREYTGKGMKPLWGMTPEDWKACMDEAVPQSEVVYNGDPQLINEYEKNGVGLILPFYHGADDRYKVNPGRVSPLLPGCRLNAGILARYADPSDFNAELILKNPEWYQAICVFVGGGACRWLHYDVEPGTRIDIELSAVCLSASIERPQGFVINEGPAYEIGLQSFLEANPDKTDADFGGTRVSMDNMVMLEPTDDSTYYEYFGPVLEVEQASFCGIPVYLAVVPLIRDGDSEVRAKLCIRSDRLKEPWRVGDRISAEIWLQARVLARTSQ